ncbi:MAG TPA: thioredoxin family protein [Solirubrobacterales bacterium]|nr:thioredoxin family protein [Solirubrobacterales bacterium]
MSDGISIGDRAPEFSLADTSGAEHAVGGDGGGDAAATVVYWTCNHCPYALAWQPRIHDVVADYGDRGVRFLAVNSNDPGRYPADSPAAMADRVEREGVWEHPFLHDPTQEVARAFGAQKTPDVFVFDRDLALRYRGAPDGDYDDEEQRAGWLREALDAVLAGHEVDRDETEPVGCSIKWR